MASIDDGELLLEIPAASRDELEEGLGAARRVFDAHGVDPAAAFAGAERFASLGAAPGTDDRHHADIVEEAYEAAERAACRVWQVEPEWTDLQLVEESCDAGVGRSSDEPHYRTAKRQRAPGALAPELVH